MSNIIEREYSLEAFLNNEFFENFLIFAKEGKNRAELLQFLIRNDFEELDSKNYINDLITSEILVSELIPILTDDYLLAIQRFVNREQVNNNFADGLRAIIHLLNEKNNITPQNLNKIKKQLNDLSINHNVRHILHCDYFQETTDFQINRKSVNKVTKALERVKAINDLQFKESPLQKFKENFIKKYGTKHVNLCEALDLENGLGQIFTNKTLQSESFLDDIITPKNKSKYVELVWDDKTQFLNQILQDYFRDPNTKNGIDLKSIVTSVDGFHLDNTCSIMIDLLGFDENDPIFLEHVITSNTIGLSARFSHLHKDISTYLDRMVIKEKENTHKLNAELVYLPENRTKNVLRRPILFDYEIPYLAQASVPLDQQIFVNDLYLHIEDGILRLYSKKLNKEIKPVVSNAHNFIKNTLPVYHFLAVYGSDQNKYNFNWGALDKIYSFLPRVFFENVIVSLARWKFYKNQINFLNVEKPEVLQKCIKNWRITHKIPQWIQIGQGDRLLPINLNNLDSIDLFLNFIKDKEEFIVQEYLSKSSSLKIDKPVSHGNQIIISLYNA